MSRLTTRLALPATVFLLAVAGCSSTTSKAAPGPSTAPSTQAAPSGTTAAPSSPAAPSTSSSPPDAAAAQIVINNFAFSPMDLTVQPGQTVTVVNQDSATHTLTASPGTTFDTGPINPGKSGTFTAPTTPGTYPYVCSIHGSMHGTLTVK